MAWLGRDPARPRRRSARHTRLAGLATAALLIAGIAAADPLAAVAADPAAGTRETPQGQADETGLLPLFLRTVTESCIPALVERRSFAAREDGSGQEIRIGTPPGSLEGARYWSHPRLFGVFAVTNNDPYSCGAMTWGLEAAEMFRAAEAWFRIDRGLDRQGSLPSGVPEAASVGYRGALEGREVYVWVIHNQTDPRPDTAIILVTALDGGP